MKILINGRCPLADADVTLVVDARADDAAFTDAEFGAGCHRAPGGHVGGQQSDPQVRHR